MPTGKEFTRIVRALTHAAAGRRAALLLGLALCAPLAACSTGPQGTPATNSSTLIQVAAAESVWGDIAQQLGGSYVHVTSIVTGTTADPRSYKPTAADLTAVDGSALFVLTGAGYDPWADQAAAAQHGIGRLEINAGDQVGVAPGGNPYLWYDPGYVLTVAQQITADYIQLRPADKSFFQQQQSSFEAGISPAQGQFAALKARFHGAPVAASDPLVLALSTPIGLDLVTSQQYLDAGGAPAAAPAAIQAVQSQITGGAARVFVYDEADHSPGAIAEIGSASAVHMPVAALAELPAAGDTYQDWIGAQLGSLQTALTEAGAGAGR